MQNFLNWLQKNWLYQALLRVQEFILFLTSCVMVGVLGVVVACRYVSHTDVFGYDEIVMISAFWMYFIGSSYAMQRGEHVRADIIERMLKPGPKRIFRIVSGIAQTLIALETARLSILYIINGIMIWPTTSAWGLPMMTSMSAVTVGFVLMAFYVVIQLLQEIAGSPTGTTTTTSSSEERV